MRNKEKIRRELANNKAIAECACRFGVVGDQTRVKICWLLRYYPELTVSEIAEILGVSISAVSHSLKKLRRYEIVNARREHKRVFYRLTNSDFSKIIKLGLPRL